MLMIYWDEQAKVQDHNRFANRPILASGILVNTFLGINIVISATFTLASNANANYKTANKALQDTYK